MRHELQTGPGIVKKLLKIANETNNPELAGVAERFNQEFSNYIRKRRMEIYHDTFSSTTRQLWSE
jgi:hypothetical protein